MNSVIKSLELLISKGFLKLKKLLNSSFDNQWIQHFVTKINYATENERKQAY